MGYLAKGTLNTLYIWTPFPEILDPPLMPLLHFLKAAKALSRFWAGKLVWAFAACICHIEYKNLIKTDRLLKCSLEYHIQLQGFI